MPRTFTINPAAPDNAALHEAAGIIRAGGIAVYPTETVYGLGVLFDNRQAIERLFEVKGRPETNPVLLLIRSSADLDMLTPEVLPEAAALARRWWPGPLTMLFRARPDLPPLLTGGQGKIGCRISSNAVARRLAELAGAPITSTSANLSGSPAASRVSDIPGELLERADVIIDAGAAPGGTPSTVLDVSSLPFTVARQGAIPTRLLFP